MTLMTVVSVNVGTAQYIGSRRGQPVYSAMRKRPVFGDYDLRLTPLGLEGDEQAEQRTGSSGRPLHGGALMALYAYPFNHYMRWRMEYGLDVSAGSFGDNLTVGAGITEADVFVGDQWSWGTAIVQITGPRRPGYKLDVLWGEGTAKAMQDNGRCGWYFRVIQPGRVPALMSNMRLVHRRPDAPNVLEVFRRNLLNDPTVPDIDD